MARLDSFLFGYRVVRVDEKDVVKLSNILLKLGINADISLDGEFYLRERDVKSFKSLARSKIRFTMSETRGFYGFLKRNAKRYGVFAAILVLTFLNIFLSDLVWDIRVEGNQSVPDYKVIEELRTHGFEIGDRWSRADKNKIETQLLSDSESISWISINRRGTVAYVEVMEAENLNKEPAIGPEYSNIVADRDAVIEEITVKRGVAAVKVGDVVKKGDILISGVVENESGVTFCRAEGTVKGQSSVSVSAEVPRTESKKVYAKERVSEIKITLFKFSINIFKNYGNRANECDIIKDTREFALFDKYKLPFSIIKTYSKSYSEETFSYTDDEMTYIAREMLNNKISAMFHDSDIVKMKTYGAFDSDKYVLTSDVVYSEDIGKESAIEIG